MTNIYPRAYMPNDSIHEPDSEDYRINLHDSWQVLWWCQFLGVTRTELEQAVKNTGTNANDVQRFFSKKN